METIRGYKGSEEVLVTNGVIDKISSTYYTVRTPAHFFKKYNGFAISLKHFKDLEINNIKTICIIYHSSNGEILNHYSKIEDWKNKSKTYSNLVNGTEDIQKVLSIKEMEIKK